MTIVPFLNRVNDLILNPIILLLFALAMMYFFYGVFQFVASDADDKSSKRIEARNAIMWGIVGMVIMFSVYGLIEFVLDTFGVENIDTTAGQFIKQ